MLDFFNALLRPLELVVAWIMVAFHTALTSIGLSAESGWTWAASIVGLVIVIRILLIPLFVKQIKASRGLQLVQPELKKIQAKYKGKSDTASRQAMQAETMALYRETGTNPFASCLPILLQSPIFFALFRVLNGISENTAIGALNPELVKQADSATVFGAPLSDTFLRADTLSTQILTVVLIILMSASTFTTQRQLMRKNMPAAALDNPFAQQQKIMLYVLPVVFGVSGVNFPIGVLIYWLTTNLWSMGQQFYVIRRMPAPGSPAEKALQERRRRRGKGGVNLEKSGATSGDDSDDGPAPAAASGQRQQPKRQPKSKRSASRAVAPPPEAKNGTDAKSGTAAQNGTEAKNGTARDAALRDVPDVSAGDTDGVSPGGQPS